MVWEIDVGIIELGPVLESSSDSRSLSSSSSMINLALFRLSKSPMSGERERGILDAAGVWGGFCHGGYASSVGYAARIFSSAKERPVSRISNIQNSVFSMSRRQKVPFASAQPLW